MSFEHVAVLSIVEGITEFLPISSTGHLILASKLLGIAPTEFTKSFDIIIQLGAIMAVATMYWKKLLTQKTLWFPLMVAFVPTALVGFTLYPIIKGYLLDNTLITVASLFVGGLILIGFEMLHKEKSLSLTWQRALIIGVFQALSIVPGVSRAAATIVGGLIVGLSRKEAVEFSFLLALPTMAAATGLDLVKNAGTFQPNQFIVLGLGFAVSWITAYITVKTFLSYITTHNFTAFGIYRVVLAVAFWFFVGIS